MVDCNFYLISLPSEPSAGEFLSKAKSEPPLIRGVPHGWIHEPHNGEAKSLLSQSWNLFLLTQSSDHDLGDVIKKHAADFVKGTVSIPQAQYDQLVADRDTRATPSNDTPPLAQEWSDGQTGQIPDRHWLPPKDGPLEPGELKLYRPMATYLSTTLPTVIRDKPVSLFNLFKYRNGDSSVHEHYMQGFKDKFGPAAGAQLKFMGPVSSQPTLSSSTGGDDSGGWQDANIVQYDSIWHYAYMLSTDVYAELNKDKINGLEDTCILLISEVELER